MTELTVLPGTLYGLGLAALVLLSTAAQAEPRLYDASRADQFLEPLAEDIVPEDDEMRQVWAENAAFNAGVFGRSAVSTYSQMHAQAIDTASPLYVGFNRFSHGRDLAGPGYEPFKTPNADTLYSNAYLDLSDGPVLITVPPTNGRYYTVNFLDLFGNATNISARTHGTSGGTYLIATTDWGGEVPEGAELFRVTQAYMWILMRIEVESAAELPEVRALQDGITITSTVEPTSKRAFPEPADLQNAGQYLTVLDWIVEEAGVRETEAALVHGFRGLGVGGPLSVAQAMADDMTVNGAREGIVKADRYAETIKFQNGTAVNSWREPLDIGRYGYNYSYRAGVHSLGLGANVRLENYAYTTFLDANGNPLDGSRGTYVLELDSAPPSDFFWSVTVYDQATQELFPNPAGKYLVSSNTQGLQVADDGSISITLATDASGPNAIPVPEGPFYLALRAQGPRREMREGIWQPNPVRLIEE
ncbi:DUF1254 domain-containing protein [Erythrobacter sp.]|uniref:DUF1254 domain-containing protein n=1 Tax=Erythrobacter sp. TaxID=1042 RepID=UPI003C794618